MARLSKTYQTVRELRDPEFVRLANDYSDVSYPFPTVRHALLVLSKIMLHTGRNAAEITTHDVVAYYHATWNLRGKVHGVEYGLTRSSYSVTSRRTRSRFMKRSGMVPCRPRRWSTSTRSSAHRSAIG